MEWIVLITGDCFGIDAAWFTSRLDILQYCQQILVEGKSRYNESVMYAVTNQAFNLSFAWNPIFQLGALTASRAPLLSRSVEIGQRWRSNDNLKERGNNEGGEMNKPPISWPFCERSGGNV